MHRLTCPFNTRYINLTLWISFPMSIPFIYLYIFFGGGFVHVDIGHLHVDIWQYIFINQMYHLYIRLQWSVGCLKSWAWTSCFSNSSGGHIRPKPNVFTKSRLGPERWNQMFSVWLVGILVWAHAFMVLNTTPHLFGPVEEWRGDGFITTGNILWNIVSPTKHCYGFE